jgi:hypothetical protein
MVVLLFGIPLQRYSFILFKQNKNGIIFFLICKILLEQVDLVMNAIFFCVARENLRPRHGVIFSMPCTRRGVKEI